MTKVTIDRVRNRTLTFIAFLFFGYIQTIAQTEQILTRISQVENNLMTPEQFKDSTLKRSNIYERMKFHKVPSVSIAIIHHDSIEWSKAYGFADLEQKKDATTSTQYQAASLGKSVNALCVMKLVEQGKLSLYKDIREYLITWQIPENKYSRGNKITLINLLSHTAGFNVHGFTGYQPGKKLPTTNQILDGRKPANNKAIKPILRPGTESRYSGGGALIVLGKIISDNITHDYDSLAQELLFKPLHMTNSTYREDVYGPQWPNIASGYWVDKKVPGNSFIYPAPAGLWTTPTDLSKMVIATIKAYNGERDCFLNDSLAKRMLTIPENAGSTALGFGIIDVKVDKYIMHSGANEGFRAVYACSLSGEYGVVIMTNCEESKIVNELLNSVLAVYKWKGITSYAGI